MKRSFKTGLEIPPVAVSVSVSHDAVRSVIEAACSAEKAGFDAVFLSDQSGPGMPEPAGPPLPSADPFTLAGLVAHRTSSILVVVGATIGGHRHPSVVAREITTVDRLAGGRSAVLLEPAAAGVDDVETDLEGLSEAATIVRRLFGPDPATFEGRHFWVSDAVNLPSPTSPGGPLIVVDPRAVASQSSVPGHFDQSNADVLVAPTPDRVRNLVNQSERPVIWRGILPSDRAQAQVVLSQVAEAGAAGVLVQLTDGSDNAERGAALGDRLHWAAALLAEFFPPEGQRR